MIEFLIQPRLDSPPRLEQTFFPLGFPLAVSSNSEAVLNAARDEWSAWVQAFDEPPIALKFYISGTTSRLPAASEFHASGHLFAFAADANNLAVCDTRTRSGAAWLTAAAVEDPAYFLYHFLEGMALQTIVSLYLTPIHAGFVANQRSRSAVVRRIVRGKKFSLLRLRARAAGRI